MKLKKQKISFEDEQLSSPPKTGRSYIDKIKNTNFFMKNDLEIIFNLYLVLRSGRPAWLFEMKNTESQLYLSEILEIFNDEIDFTPIDSKNFGVLIHLRTKKIPIPPNDQSLWYVWLGKVLGFFCPHDIRESSKIHNRHVISYSINDQQFYAEVCTDDLAKIANIETQVVHRQKMWQTLANEMSEGDDDLTYNITSNVYITHSLMHWYDTIAQKNFTEVQQHKNDFNILMTNSMLPLPYLREIGLIGETSENFMSNIEKYYNWILMAILMSINEEEIMGCFNEIEINTVADHIYDNEMSQNNITPSKYLVILLAYCDNPCKDRNKIIKDIFIDYNKHRIKSKKQG